jgi:hypothetical protein
MEREAILRGAQRLVVGERLTFEGPEPYCPLRSGRRRLSRHGGGGEARLRIVVDFLVLVNSKHPAAAKVLLDTSDRVFEQLPDFARPEMPEAPQDEIVLLLVPGAVEEDGVDVSIEP